MSYEKGVGFGAALRLQEIERLLRQGEEIEITKRKQVIARLVPERNVQARQMPDFLGRLRSIYGDKMLGVTGAELIAQDRNRW